MAINGIDGRVPLPVIEDIPTTYNTNDVDMITAPGVNTLLAEGAGHAVESITKKVDVSLMAQASTRIAVMEGA